MEFQSEKPVRVGQVLEVNIVDIAGQGDAVARIDNFVVFVRDAEANNLQIGHPRKVKIVELRPRFAKAIVVN